MIYYFSGTGNSKSVAIKLGKLLEEEVYDISQNRRDVEVESLGIVFPVYAWGLPKVLDKFILTLKGIKAKYVWTVMTCGDDMGYADKVLRKQMQRVGLHLDSSVSVQMPNTYVCLPGFDVDKEEVAEKKKKDTAERLPQIAERLQKKEHFTDVVRGAMPFTKTYILRPLFNATLVTDKYFKVNSGCSHCNACAKNCPLQNIKSGENGHQIKWNGDCTGCLRCYHQCPKHALHFGNMTQKKGQKK